jgi:hypothetical protein
VNWKPKTKAESGKLKLRKTDNAKPASEGKSGKLKAES